MILACTADGADDLLQSPPSALILWWANRSSCKSSELPWERAVIGKFKFVRYRNVVDITIFISSLTCSSNSYWMHWPYLTEGHISKMIVTEKLLQMFIYDWETCFNVSTERKASRTQDTISMAIGHTWHKTSQHTKGHHKRQEGKWTLSQLEIECFRHIQYKARGKQDSFFPLFTQFETCHSRNKAQTYMVPGGFDRINTVQNH